jgi:hypothetical protein
MKTYFQANGWAKFYEEDIYQEGCQPNTGGMITGNELFKAETLDGLLNDLLAFTGANYEDIQLNSCDEVGRVDISVMEDDHGSMATRKQIADWKDGEVRLWDCIYTFQVEKIQAEAVNLEEITA